ncbi:phosphatase PAP2 family protein [Lipingzhangella sp. LS1_29]|uniref:Phosphatase PAP2 family protein n=1 Tax=Lipingzhangella rawalii TaxID=2055835 RepID=A0ABU2HA93_9ACTN|nr:phosphatase PAP2 family protein [Lipingzhangella rawalii]MDS1271760.1 phosphatase PAP2 family protein [Lipingzhangella rawalii]
MTPHTPVEPQAREARRTGILPDDRRILAVVAVVAALLLVVLTSLVATRWDPLIWFDTGAALHLYSTVHPLPTLGHGLETWTDLFGTRVMIALGVLVAVWLALRRQFTSAVWALGATGAAGAVGWVMKHAVERPRPEFIDPIATGSGPAFPSGHALMATVGMGVLLFATLPLVRGAWRWVVVVLAVGVAFSTGGTRPLLGVHWISDVIAGASLGVVILAGSLLVWTFLPQSLRRWDRVPPQS